MHEEHDKGGGVSEAVWANVEILLASTELRRRTCNMGPAATLHFAFVKLCHN